MENKYAREKLVLQILKAYGRKCDPREETERLISQYVGCHEVWIKKGSNPEATYFDGEIKCEDQFVLDNCLCPGSSHRPYDSDKYKISNVPIFYFQGEHDEVTPMSGALYHLDKHKSESTETAFFKVPLEKEYLQKNGEKLLGGVQHGPMYMQPLKDCRENLWQSIFTGNRREVERVYNRCINGAVASPSGASVAK
ncbi:MAG: hypothetical protein A4S09_13725 [Proteobacteria bacterium SG_bin7]|nr:MAG: hypothetical protein A4S09_13725 [Proteobacteria bacterium SG_bin7]